MKTTVFMNSMVVLLVAASCLYAAEAPKSRIVSQKDIPEFLTTAMPNEYAEFLKVKAGGDQLATCKSVIVLLDKAYQLQREKPVKKGNGPGSIVECMTWKLVVETYKSSSDIAAKTLIKNAWNSYLEEDRECKHVQLFALFHDWDSSLMTDEALEVFKTTLDPMTITGFTIIFSRYGEDRERGLLVDKLADVENNLKGKEPAYTVATSNIKNALDTLDSWKMHKVRGWTKSPAIK